MNGCIDGFLILASMLSRFQEVFKSLETTRLSVSNEYKAQSETRLSSNWIGTNLFTVASQGIILASQQEVTFVFVVRSDSHKVILRCLVTQNVSEQLNLPVLTSNLKCCRINQFLFEKLEIINL